MGAGAKASWSWRALKQLVTWVLRWPDYASAPPSAPQPGARSLEARLPACMPPGSPGGCHSGLVWPETPRAWRQGKWMLSPQWGQLNFLFRPPWSHARPPQTPLVQLPSFYLSRCGGLMRARAACVGCSAGGHGVRGGGMVPSSRPVPSVSPMAWGWPRAGCSPACLQSFQLCGDYRDTLGRQPGGAGFTVLGTGCCFPGPKDQQLRAPPNDGSDLPQVCAGDCVPDHRPGCQSPSQGKVVQSRSVSAMYGD